MKKLTLLLAAAVMLSGGTLYAQHCCKKGHCTKACAKDKKNAQPASAKESKATNTSAKAEPPKKSY